MTPKERIEQLLSEGACLTVFPKGLGSITTLIGVAHQLEKPDRLRWCGCFPEHQGHVHDLRYDTLRFEAGERDVAFVLGGNLVGYLCPMFESGDDHDVLADTWGRWQHRLGLHNNRAEMDEFLTGAIA